MEDNNNKNNGLLPNMPSPGTLWASWSVFLGGLGLIGNCMCGPIWGLPAGLTLGLLGIACAVASKKGKPFTQQAQLGLILSILAAVCGLLMTFFIIIVYDVMGTDTSRFAEKRAPGNWKDNIQFPGALFICSSTSYFSSGSKSTPRNTSM